MNIFKRRTAAIKQVDRALKPHLRGGSVGWRFDDATETSFSGVLLQGYQAYTCAWPLTFTGTRDPQTDEVHVSLGQRVA